MKYRKKPVVIEAEKAANLIDWGQNDWSKLPLWAADAYGAGRMIVVSKGIIIKTLEGDLKADPSDMIIQGIKGEIYPCKPDIFAATYEPVDD